MMTETFRKLRLGVESELRFVLIADVHADRRADEILRQTEQLRPDAVLIAGDLCHSYRDIPFADAFLRRAAELAPVFYSYGNHEQRISVSEFDGIEGLSVLNSSYAKFRDITIGGIRSGYTGEAPAGARAEQIPDITFLDSFERIDGIKILLCHHPEYYPRYIKGRDIDLTVAGHAHGGQWRFFGRGIYAPGQGLFPKYTSGLIDGRLLVSRGLSNHSLIPRIFNPPEIVVLDIC